MMVISQRDREKDGKEEYFSLKEGQRRKERENISFRFAHFKQNLYEGGGDMSFLPKSTLIFFFLFLLHLTKRKGPIQTTFYFFFLLH